MQAEMFYRAGYTEAYTYGSSAPKRVMDFYYGLGTNSPMMQFPNTQSIAFWVANHRYGQQWTPPISGLGKPDDGWGFTDVSHAGPAQIQNLTIGSGFNSLTLSFTAPCATATSYDVRVSDVPITEAGFFDAPEASGEPTPKDCGESESFSVGGLCTNTTYYFAVRSKNALGYSGVAFKSKKTLGSGTPNCPEGPSGRVRSRFEGTGLPVQSFYTVREARQLEGVVWFDLLGRKLEALRPGVYWVQIGDKAETRRQVVVR